MGVCRDVMAMLMRQGAAQLGIGLALGLPLAFGASRLARFLREPDSGLRRRYNCLVSHRDNERATRASWPIRRYRLGEEPGDDLSASTTAEERLAMVWPLTLDAWAMAGKALPTYTRGETPIRVVPSGVRRHETPKE
jgi:hypothetical protein